MSYTLYSLLPPSFPLSLHTCATISLSKTVREDQEEEEEEGREEEEEQGIGEPSGPRMRLLAGREEEEGREEGW